VSGAGEGLILIGLDDTDNATSRGTGHLARTLLAECVRRGLAAGAVTRHQLLLDDRIPYTSHNSAACVAVVARAGESCDFAFDFVAARAAPGADPGVCVGRAEGIGDGAAAFGRRATAEVLDMPGAFEAAGGAGVALRALGGSGLGVIGALAAVGLRSGGEDGRIIDMPGLRELSGRVGAERLRRLGIELAHLGGRRPEPSDAYETFGWVRPRMAAGRPLWPVQWSDETHAWIPVDRKRTGPVG
jgi:hypothetical protein